MKTAHFPLADPMKILTRSELLAVLAELDRKAQRSASTRLNRAVFRLAACCGLRASEIAQLHISEVFTQLPRPHLRIRAGAAKGNWPRVVPLWWDAGTLAEVRDAAGHANVSVTSGYLHVAVEDEGVGSLFAGGKSSA